MDLPPYLDQGLYKSYGFSVWLKLKPDHLSAMVYSFSHYFNSHCGLYKDLLHFFLKSTKINIFNYGRWWDLHSLYFETKQKEKA